MANSGPHGQTIKRGSFSRIVFPCHHQISDTPHLHGFPNLQLDNYTSHIAAQHKQSNTLASAAWATSSSAHRLPSSPNSPLFKKDNKQE